MMPTYEFRCPLCNHTVTMVLTVDKRDTVFTCPTDGLQLQRIYTTPAITFKGDGFYTTDKGN